MSSNYLNDDNHINCLDITWSSSSKKKKAELYQRLTFIRTLTYYNNLTQTFIYLRTKMIFCKTKFFISCVDAWDRLSKSKKIVLFSQSLMRWDVRQVWWDDAFVKLNEMTFSFVKFDESFSSNLMSRFRQVWWIVSLQIWWDASSSLTSHHRRRSTDRE
jgi:hypothetical protein